MTKNLGCLRITLVFAANSLIATEDDTSRECFVAFSSPDELAKSSLKTPAETKPAAIKLATAFRVKGRYPERWNPDSCSIFGTVGWHEADGTTDMHLALESNESTFTLFLRQGAAAGRLSADVSDLIPDLPVRHEFFSSVECALHTRAWCSRSSWLFRVDMLGYIQKPASGII